MSLAKVADVVKKRLDIFILVVSILPSKTLTYVKSLLKKRVFAHGVLQMVWQLQSLRVPLTTQIILVGESKYLAKLCVRYQNARQNFPSPQDGEWLCHCGDACQFLGHIADIDKSLLGTEAAQKFIQRLREETRMEGDEHWNEVLSTPMFTNNLAIFVFVCLHCGTLDGYRERLLFIQKI